MKKGTDSLTVWIGAFVFSILVWICIIKLVAKLLR